MTALMWASEGGHEESVRTLIEKGASLEAVNEVRIPSKSTYESDNNIQYIYSEIITIPLAHIMNIYPLLNYFQFFL